MKLLNVLIVLDLLLLVIAFITAVLAGVWA